MDYFEFIVSRDTQEFVGIVKVKSTEVTSSSFELYSALVTDEATARANFTLTGHLPSQKFEELLKEAKNETIAL